MMNSTFDILNFLIRIYALALTTALCGPPPKVRSASIYGKVVQKYQAGASVRYHCAEGFRQRRNPLVSCLPGGRWEEPQIQCIPGES